MRNGDAKERKCTTHGHELRGGCGECWWEGCVGWRGIKGRQKWDNCNIIINKIYLKKGVGKRRMSRWNIGDFQSSENPLYFSILMDTCHTFVQTPGYKTQRVSSDVNYGL